MEHRDGSAWESWGGALGGNLCLLSTCQEPAAWLGTDCTLPHGPSQQPYEGGTIISPQFPDKEYCSSYILLLNGPFQTLVTETKPLFVLLRNHPSGQAFLVAQMVKNLSAM